MILELRERLTALVTVLGFLLHLVIVGSSAVAPDHTVLLTDNLTVGWHHVSGVAPTGKQPRPWMGSLFRCQLDGKRATMRTGR